MYKKNLYRKIYFENFAIQPVPIHSALLGHLQVAIAMKLLSTSVLLAMLTGSPCLFLPEAIALAERGAWYFSELCNILFSGYLTVVLKAAFQIDFFYCYKVAVTHLVYHVDHVQVCLG